MNLPPLNNVTTLMPTNMDADGEGPLPRRFLEPISDEVRKLMRVAMNMDGQIKQMQESIRILMHEIHEFERKNFVSKRQRHSGLPVDDEEPPTTREIQNLEEYGRDWQSLSARDY